MLFPLTPCRVKVNNPSIFQQFNKFHGRVGIAVPDKTFSDTILTVYFTEGKVLSQKIHISALDKLG